MRDKEISVKRVAKLTVRNEEHVIDAADFGVGPTDIEGEMEGTFAVGTGEMVRKDVESADKFEICATTAKAKRLACPRIEHAHLRKKRYKGFRRKREQYGIDADSGALQTFHRSKLRMLLNSLMQQRRWNEASGVIGVLLTLPFNHRENSGGFQGCRSDYWAAMMVLRRLEDSQAGAMRCRRMFRLLNRHQPNARCRGEIQLESALFLITQGDREAAYNELRPIADGPVFRDDPVVNLCHGLNTHCLWYEAAVEENSKDVSEVRGDSSGRSSGPQEVIGETEAPEPSVNTSSGTDRYPRGGSPEGSVFSRDSSRYRGVSGQARHSSQGNEVVAYAWQASQQSIYEETNEEGFVEGGEQVWLNATVPLSSELDRRLFPVRVVPHPDRQNQHYRVAMNDGRTRDFHAAAVKHLKQALLSAPDLLPALLPLVQLLLAVHDVKGAVDEIDRCAQALKNHITPPSIKALLLESLKYKDYALLEGCYQRVLSINPFSEWALKGLLNMHSSGQLRFEVLLDSIALHLDAASGSVEVWRKLSSSLLEVGKASSALPMEAGTMTQDTNLDGEEKKSLVNREYVQKLWSSPRYQLWLKKHFSAEIMEKHQEQSSGDRRLVAYKAACAAHFYGPHFLVVEGVCTFLERQGDDALYKLVRRHRNKSLNLFAEQYSVQ